MQKALVIPASEQRGGSSMYEHMTCIVLGRY